MAAVIVSNYILYYWCYDINNMKNMLLYRLSGNPDIEGILPLAEMAGQKGMDNIQTVSGAIFVVCLFAICWLCRPHKKDVEYIISKDAGLNIVHLSAIRFVINTVVCSVPVLMFLSAAR